MESSIEFYVSPDGCLYYKENNQEAKVLTANDREIVIKMVEMIENRFPETFKRLSEKFSASQLNKYAYQYRIADNFIRCNFGENDRLTVDMKDIYLNFEEVRCPLRGICKDEGIICKPKSTGILAKEERKVVELYSHGFSLSEIAIILKKSVNTVNVQLFRIKKKLHLKKTHDIIKVYNIYNL